MAVLKRADITNQIPQLWAANLFSAAENLTFWQRFEGPEGSSMPLLRKDDLEQQAGDTVKVDIVLALTGAGQTGDTALLDGNEEKMVFNQMSFTVDSLQHALRWSKLGKILIDHDMRSTAVNQLSKWVAGKLDDRCFATFTGETIGGFVPQTVVGSLPANMKWFAGSATTVATVDNTDAAGRLKLNDISDFKAFLQTTNKIEPLRMENGEEVFGLVLHPYAALALKKDTQWQQAQRDAQVRGADNPLFTGAVGMWDGVVLYVSNRVPTAADGVASAVVARNVFFGAQAQIRGFAYYPDWTEQYFSYGQEQGIATFMALGQKLTLFDAGAGVISIGAGILYSNATAPVA